MCYKYKGGAIYNYDSIWNWAILIIRTWLTLEMCQSILTDTGALVREGEYL